MPAPYKPELGGTMAVYYRSDDETERYPYRKLREIIGWDRSGRPLVMCGDSLCPATEARFAHWRDYSGLETFTDPQSALYEAVAERVKEEFWFDAQRIFIACVEESVEKIIGERIGDVQRIFAACVEEAVEKITRERLGEAS